MLLFNLQNNNNTRGTKNQERSCTILTDKKPNGKERPWKERKEQSREVSDILEEGSFYEYKNQFTPFGMYTFETLEDFKIAKKNYENLISNCNDSRHNKLPWLAKKSGLVYHCGSTLEFTVDENNQKRLFRAWFCKDRLCPMCNWRRSIKLREQLKAIFVEMQNRKIDGFPILLTLTMKNVKGQNISQSFSDYAEGFNRLMKYKKVKDLCLGAVRSSEITYNSERDDYNTHIHCILYMVPGYQTKERHYKIVHDDWVSLWKRAAKLDYEPSVSVKTFKKEEPTPEDPSGYMKSILEVTKYVTKTAKLLRFPANIYNPTDEQALSLAKQRVDAGRRLSELERGLYRKRLIGLFGIFKQIHKDLHLDDVEEGDLVGEGEEKAESVKVIRYTWNNKNGADANYMLTGVGHFINDEKKPAVEYTKEWNI